MTRGDVVISTPYPEVNAILSAVLSGARGALGPHLVGMYLYGSLATGDFDPQSSDVDFLVVTESEVTEATFQALAAMHARLAASGLPWATRLEGSYIPRAALRRYDPEDGPHPMLLTHEPLYLSAHGSDWILQRAMLREQGIVLAGPDPCTLIDPVARDDVRAAVRAVLQQWWAPMLDNSTFLHGHGYPAFAVLTMCRALYTLESGALASKPVAAQWAQIALDPHWTPLIERAVTERNDMPAGNLREIQDFIRYTVTRGQKWERETREE